jgi:crotonobetainyl-CoA:carnitine CoA-transferase CaiB-like acyl-CoA transferase
VFADMGADVLKIETPPDEPEDEAARRRAAFVLRESQQALPGD